MIGKRGVVAAVLAGSLLGGAACGPKKDATMGPSVQTDAQGQTPDTGEARVAQIGDAIERFNSSRASLSGHGDDQSRKALADTLTKLQDVLSRIEGQQPAGAFRQQMRIIERAVTQLTGGSSTAPEPTINAAMRAAQGALAGIASDQFPDDAEIANALAALRPRIDELDTVRGPLHGFVAAQALDQTAAVAQRMADVLKGRLPQGQPATAPTTNPA